MHKNVENKSYFYIFSDTMNSFWLINNFVILGTRR